MNVLDGGSKTTKLGASSVACGMLAIAGTAAAETSARTTQIVGNGIGVALIFFGSLMMYQSHKDQKAPALLGRAVKIPAPLPDQKKIDPLVKRFSTSSNIWQKSTMVMAGIVGIYGLMKLGSSYFSPDPNQPTTPTGQPTTPTGSGLGAANTCPISAEPICPVSNSSFLIQEDDSTNSIMNPLATHFLDPSIGSNTPKVGLNLLPQFDSPVSDPSLTATDSSIQNSLSLIGSLPKAKEQATDSKIRKVEKDLPRLSNSNGPSLAATNGSNQTFPFFIGTCPKAEEQAIYEIPTEIETYPKPEEQVIGKIRTDSSLSSSYWSSLKKIIKLGFLCGGGYAAVRLFSFWQHINRVIAATDFLNIVKKTLQSGKNNDGKYDPGNESKKSVNHDIVESRDPFMPEGGSDTLPFMPTTQQPQLDAVSPLIPPRIQFETRAGATLQLQRPEMPLSPLDRAYFAIRDMGGDRATQRAFEARLLKLQAREQGKEEDDPFDFVKRPDKIVKIGN